MLRRRQINSEAGSTRLRPALATAVDPVRHAAWSLEDRFLWRAGELLRAAAAAVRWPFERLVRTPLERLTWPLEERVLWPLEERLGGHGLGDRGLPLGGAALAVLVAAGGIALAILAGGGGGSSSAPDYSRLPAASRTALSLSGGGQAAAPVLHGAAPDFKPPGPKPPGGEHAATVSRGSATPAPSATASASAPSGKTATTAPAALKVAHRFADAFVLYETGQTGNDVRAVFGATATQRLAQALLRRPPRLPANVKVPQAKVLNVVPGPSNGATYTVSVSLLRVGVTSELRLQMQRDPKSDKWQVADVLG